MFYKKQGLRNAMYALYPPDALAAGISNNFKVGGMSRTALIMFVCLFLFIFVERFRLIVLCQFSSGVGSGITPQFCKQTQSL